MGGPRFVGSLVLAAAAYASGGAAAPTPGLAGVVSGSRLRAKFIDAGEGTLRFTGWFDTELGLPCVFKRTRGGPMRCLPGPLAVHSEEIPAERFVAGTVRTVPIESGAFAIRESQGADGSSWVSVEASGRFSQVTRLDELPPNTVAYRGSGRLRVLSYVDGQGRVLDATMLDGFFDTEADAPCHMEQFADGLRCVPRSVASSSVDGPYLDAGCTMRLSQRSPSRSGVPEPPPGQEAFAVETNGLVSTAYTLGDTVIPETVYFDPPTCRPMKAEPPAHVVYRRLGTPTRDSQWAPVTVRME